MTPFIHEDFLLQSTTARHLYHEYAKELPIIDYHCHLPPEQVAADHSFRSMTELWLSGDHYKWRAMRANGESERLCTGDASDWEKFQAWARTVPFTLRNPLYHWTHLELAFPFGLKTLLNEATAPQIYARCNECLAQPQFTALGLMRQYRVELVCTTDDPIDTLEHHIRHSAHLEATPRMFPTWRPDRALGIEQPACFRAWLEKLEALTHGPITTYDHFLAALEQRHTFFHQVGCRLSDHGLQHIPGALSLPQHRSAHAVQTTFAKARQGTLADPAHADGFRAVLLHDLALLDHRRGWVQQFHIGAMRDNNTRLYHAVGPNTGFDSIGEGDHARPLARFLDGLDQSEQLAKTILYNLNPKDNEAFATLIGNFQDGSCPAKLQLGSAWWFLDQLDGIKRQLEALSNMGLLSRFVGMLTDSRSFVSYSRHEYFRRLLCDLLGGEIERGVLPNDLPLVGGLIRGVCYENARTYFAWPTSE